MNAINILLVDDQILFVESLKIVLESRTKDIKVVGIARQGQEAIDIITETQPDIILMDVRMPELDGVEATKEIKKKYPEIKIIMLTTFKDDEYVIKALRYGAVGYLLKSIPPLELIASIRLVNEGTVLISPSVIGALVKQTESSDDTTNIELSESDRKLDLYKSLSKREKDVLRFLSKAYDNKEIAEELYISEQTVKNYISTIYSKLEVGDRVHAMKLVHDFREISVDLHIVNSSRKC